VEACNVSITSCTQDSSPITRRAWVDLTFQEMTLVHPLHICTIDTEPLLIGQDLLDRLTPLIDCHCGHIWAQVDTPKPLSQSALGGHVATIRGTFGPRPKLMPLSEPDPGSDLLPPPPATIQPASASNRDSLHSHESCLCALKNTNPALYSPLIIGGVHLNGVSAPDALLALWSEKSAISQDSYNDLCLLNPSPTFALRSHRLLSAQTPQTPIKAFGVCALCAHCKKRGCTFEYMTSGQTVPPACQVASEVDLSIPACTVGAPIRLQQEQLQGLGETLQGTVVTVNLHSTILNNTLHALGTLSEIVREDVTYVQGVRDLMQDLLRKISSSVNSLSSGRIPAYLVPLDLVTQILKCATTTVVCPSQVHLAYNLGSAIPISVNPQSLEIGFLLNLPIIERQNIYRLKSVLNVGFWKGNTHIHLKTPTSLAYHDDHPSLYLIPNLDMCTKTKDIHWVCPGNPFVRDVTNYLCGLRAKSPEQKCQAKMSVKDEQTGTKVERADRHKVEIEVMDAFQGHNLTIDDTLQQQLLAEGTKLVQLSLKPTGLATTFNSRLSRPSSYQEHHVSLVALGLFLSGWVITAIIAHIMYRHIQTLQTRLDTLRVVQPRFAHQSVSTPRVSSSPLQE
ncbi:hypothetical protein ABVT39_024884, partial [Epinephelus coioides]